LFGLTSNGDDQNAQTFEDGSDSDDNRDSDGDQSAVHQITDGALRK
jgi:hypothetical protein